jgi:hypothetical protein
VLVRVISWIVFRRMWGLAVIKAHPVATAPGSDFV